MTVCFKIKRLKLISNFSYVQKYQRRSNPQDQDLFHTYLITNLKLYFDKFEDQLASQLMEPTTPEYEDAKKELTATEL